MSRLLRILLLLAIVLEGIWVAAANPLLAPDGVVMNVVNRHPEKLRVHWTRARSYWPGDLRLDELSIRAIQLRSQWVVSMHTVRSQVRLGPLLQRRFLPHGAIADGVTFRLRRTASSPANLARESLRPPIPSAEFEIGPSKEQARAILAAQVRPPKKRAWTVDVRKMEARSVREIWVDEFRYRGDGTASGSFRVTPREWLDVKPSVIRLAPGTVTQGDDLALTVRSGSLHLAFPRVDMAVYRGADVLQRLDAKLELAGILQFDRLPRLSQSPSEGPLRVSVNVAEGVLIGNVNVRGEDAKVSYRGMALRGDFSVDGRISGWKIGQRMIGLSGTRMSVSNASMTPVARASRAPKPWSGSITLERAHVQPGKPFKLNARMSAKVQDSRPLLRLFEAGHKNLPPPFHAALLDRDLDGTAAIRVDHGVVDVRSLELAGERLSLSARLRIEKGTQTQGILYLERNGFSIGLQKGGGQKVRFIHPKAWFEQSAFLN